MVFLNRNDFELLVCSQGDRQLILTLIVRVCSEQTTFGRHIFHCPILHIQTNQIVAVSIGIGRRYELRIGDREGVGLIGPSESIFTCSVRVKGDITLTCYDDSGVVLTCESSTVSSPVARTTDTHTELIVAGSEVERQRSCLIALSNSEVLGVNPVAGKVTVHSYGRDHYSSTGFGSNSVHCIVCRVVGNGDRVDTSLRDSELVVLCRPTVGPSVVLTYFEGYITCGQRLVGLLPGVQTLNERHVVVLVGRCPRGTEQRCVVTGYGVGVGRLRRLATCRLTCRFHSNQDVIYTNVR